MTWGEDNRGWRERVAARWATTHPEPLLLRAWLASPVAYDGYDPITCEGPLQSVAILRETGRTPDDVFAACPIDTPLCDTDITIPIADTIVAGTPIAHASIGWLSADATATKRQSWKRADAEHYNKPIIKVSEAANKTQMILKATVTASHIDFYVQGDRAQLAELLRDVSHLGAGRAGGLGQVEGWEVLPVPCSWWWIGPGKRLMRALPLDLTQALGALGDMREATLRAPYWHPRTRAACGVPTQQLGEPLGQLGGDFFITGHAVQRFRERVPGADRLSYEQALTEVIRAMRSAHFVKAQNGLDLWRGAKPHRLRFRVAPGAGALLPQVVTVLRGCDPGFQRGGL